jgi:hypothetical protein
MMPQVMARKRTSPIPTMAAINPGPRPPSIRQAWPTWGQRQDFENIFGKNGENRNITLVYEKIAIFSSLFTCATSK